MNFSTFLLILILPFLIALSPLKEMELERKEFLQNLSLSISEGTLEITIFEKKYDEVLEGHLAFCRKSNLELYDYLLRGNPEVVEFDVQEVKSSCLLSLRTWQINVEKKFYKFRREMIRSVLSREIKDLQNLEAKKIEQIIKNYSSFL